MKSVKTKKQKLLTFLLFSLIFLGFFGLHKVENVHAAATEKPSTTGQGRCISGEGISMNGKHVIENVSYTDCMTECGKYTNNVKKNCTWQSNDSGITDAGVDSEGNVSTSKEDELCPGTSWTAPISSIINCFLLIILRFLALILEAAAVLFNWIINPDNMTAIIDNKIVYSTWATVRDILNIAFILVLLFSAFATVFQVDKYSYKNLLRTLVIMALLVNFSYPITRFIIDFSNSMMYYLLSISGASDLNSNFAETIGHESTLGTIIYQKATADTAYLLASVIFLWIFTITILIIAGLFVIRAVALALLVIFSSLAFTGSIVPFLSKYSSQWWDYLFKYAFFGPVMIFMLVVATSMMKAIKLAGYSNMQSIAGTQSSSPSIVAAMAFFAIPIIILWGGINFAQSMSLIGADAVIGRGKKVVGWGVKKFSGFNFAKSQYDAYAGARKKRRDAIQNGRIMGTFGNKLNKWQDTVIGQLPLVGGSAKRRADNTRRTEAAKTVRDKAADLKGTNIEDLSVEVNNSFDATGKINPSKVNKTSAGSAQAFMDKNADDRKTFVEDALQTKGGTKAPGIIDSGFENILAGSPPNITAALGIISAGPSTAGYQDALRQVTSYINRQSEKVVNEFTK